MSKKIKISDSDENLSSNPFGGLDFSGIELSEAKPVVVKPSEQKVIKKKRGRVEIQRVKSGRGGKEVTLLSGFNPGEAKPFLKRFQKECGVGGTLKEGKLELQGDQRDKIKSLLEAEGFKVVFTGG